MQEEQAVALIDGTGEEQIFLLEHEPVYTIGRLRDQSSLGTAAEMPYPVFEISRGGQATYHGPGQWVGYPILDLTKRGRDLHGYLRGIEASLIEMCRTFGVMAERRDGFTGVWVGQRKLASIGVGVRKWVTQHGFAINIMPESLPPFLAITPCGLAGVSMTCLADETDMPISMAQVADVLGAVLSAEFSPNAT